MGRTLHFSITKDKGTFTKKDLEIIENISEFYNSDELLNDINKAYKTSLKNIWSCENFSLGLSGNYYPNWDKPRNSWDIANAHIEKLGKTMSFIDAILQAEKDGVIKFHHEDYKTNFHGFTKVQGNEFNSLLVFKALVELSKKIPTATIYLSDEGEFLLCPLKIKAGKALPDIEDLLNDMRHYALKMLFSKGFAGNILDKITPTNFDNCFKGDIGIENTYGDMTNFINEKLRNLKEIENAIKGTLKGYNDNALYFYNIEHRQLKNWFDPEIFTRPVNVEKFLNYQMSEKSLMDGFSGQGFGLTDKDGEAESYKMMANLFSMLAKSQIDTEKLKILGRDY